VFKQLRISLYSLAALVVLAGCDGNSSNAVDIFTLQGCADTGTCAPNPPLVLGGERPAMAQIPSDYDSGTRYPLVVVLHGRGVNGQIQALYMGLFDRIDRQQFVLVYPDGLAAADGRRQWRSTPTCCDTPPDEANEISDVPYLKGLIREAAAT
jgi:poly(3-hydroxybutyrate) depolymerase